MMSRHATIAKRDDETKSTSGMRTSHTLVYRICEARELPKMDVIGSIDAYVVVKIDEEVVDRTPTIWNTYTPFYMHDGEIPLNNAFDVVRFVLWDEDKHSAHDIVGDVCFPMSILSDHAEHDQWYPIFPADSEAQRISGNILVELLYQPDDSGMLIVNVLSGSNMIAKDANGKSDPYCVIKFRDKTHKTEIVKKTLNPEWNDSFCIPLDGKLLDKDDVVEFVVMDWDRLSADDFMGQAIIHPLELLVPNSPCRYKLSLSGKPTKREQGEDVAVNLGQIRIKIQYLVEDVLQLENYKEFIELISHPIGGSLSYSALQLIAQCSTDREYFAKHLIKLLIGCGTAEQFLLDVNSAEVLEHSDPNTIFRGNSVASKLMDMYQKAVGLEYLKSTLSDPIDEIYKYEKTLEVDPSKITNEKDVTKIQDRFVILETMFESLLTAILNSKDKMPVEFRRVFYNLRKEVLQQFPTDDVIPYTAVAGFLFLRFFCPCILNPKLFGLQSKHPDDIQGRTLTLMAKTMQNLANMVEFGWKEEYMKPMNGVIKSHMTEMKEFLDFACTITPAEQPLKTTASPAFGAPVDVAREASAVYSHANLLMEKILMAGIKERDKYEASSQAIVTCLDKITNDIKERKNAAVPLKRGNTTFSSMLVDSSNTKLLIRGFYAQKLTTGGKKHKRYIQCSTQLDKFYWKQSMDGKIDADRVVYTCDITDVLTGHMSSGFQKAKVKTDPACCFSVVTKNKTIDFEAENANSCDLIVKGLKDILNNDKPLMK